jgi:DNA invertase Pin-like site-specific DNA recombinase
LRRCADVFVVTRLERFARSIAHLVAVLPAMERKRLVVRILNLGLDTQTPTGKLRLAGRQFERELMLQRQREGIAKAKSAGNCKG